MDTQTCQPKPGKPDLFKWLPVILTGIKTLVDLYLAFKK